jgi:hypothetical protein
MKDEGFRKDEGSRKDEGGSKKAGQTKGGHIDHAFSFYLPFVIFHFGHFSFVIFHFIYR